MIWINAVLVLALVMKLSKTQELVNSCPGVTVTAQGFNVSYYNYPLASIWDTSGHETTSFFLHGYLANGAAWHYQTGVTDINLYRYTLDAALSLGFVYGVWVPWPDFALEYQGWYQAELSGVYTFQVTGKSGMSLQIGAGTTCCGDFDSQIVTQDLVYSSNSVPTNTSVEMIAGQYYPIRMVYYNGWIETLINLSVTLPDGSTQTTFTNVYQVQSCTSVSSIPAQISALPTSSSLPTASMGSNAVSEMPSKAPNTVTTSGSKSVLQRPRSAMYPMGSSSRESSTFSNSVASNIAISSNVLPASSGTTKSASMASIVPSRYSSNSTHALNTADISASNSLSRSAAQMSVASSVYRSSRRNSIRFGDHDTSASVSSNFSTRSNARAISVHTASVGQAASGASSITTDANSNLASLPSGNTVTARGVSDAAGFGNRTSLGSTRNISTFTGLGSIERTSDTLAGTKSRSAIADNGNSTIITPISMHGVRESSMRGNSNAESESTRSVATGVNDFNPSRFTDSNAISRNFSVRASARSSNTGSVMSHSNINYSTLRLTANGSDSASLSGSASATDVSMNSVSRNSTTVGDKHIFSGVRYATAASGSTVSDDKTNSSHSLRVKSVTTKASLQIFSSSTTIKTVAPNAASGSLSTGSISNSAKLTSSIDHSNSVLLRASGTANTNTESSFSAHVKSVSAVSTFAVGTQAKSELNGFGTNFSTTSIQASRITRSDRSEKSIVHMGTKTNSAMLNSSTNATGARSTDSPKTSNFGTNTTIDNSKADSFGTGKSSTSSMAMPSSSTNITGVTYGGIHSSLIPSSSPTISESFKTSKKAEATNYYLNSFTRISIASGISSKASSYDIGTNATVTVISRNSDSVSSRKISTNRGVVATSVSTRVHTLTSMSATANATFTAVVSEHSRNINTESDDSTRISSNASTPTSGAPTTRSSNFALETNTVNANAASVQLFANSGISVHATDTLRSSTISKNGLSGTEASSSRRLGVNVSANAPTTDINGNNTGINGKNTANAGNSVRSSHTGGVTGISRYFGSIISISGGGVHPNAGTGLINSGTNITKTGSVSRSNYVTSNNGSRTAATSDNFADSKYSTSIGAAVRGTGIGGSLNSATTWTSARATSIIKTVSEDSRRDNSSDAMNAYSNSISTRSGGFAIRTSIHYSETSISATSVTAGDFTAVTGSQKPQPSSFNGTTGSTSAAIVSETSRSRHSISAQDESGRVSSNISAISRVRLPTSGISDNNMGATSSSHRTSPSIRVSGGATAASESSDISQHEVSGTGSALSAWTSVSVNTKSSTSVFGASSERPTEAKGNSESSRSVIESSGMKSNVDAFSSTWHHIVRTKEAVIASATTSSAIKVNATVSNTNAHYFGSDKSERVTDATAIFTSVARNTSIARNTANGTSRSVESGLDSTTDGYPDKSNSGEATNAYLNSARGKNTRGDSVVISPKTSTAVVKPSATPGSASQSRESMNANGANYQVSGHASSIINKSSVSANAATTERGNVTITTDINAMSSEPVISSTGTGTAKTAPKYSGLTENVRATGAGSRDDVGYFTSSNKASKISAETRRFSDDTTSHPVNSSTSGSEAKTKSESKSELVKSGISARSKSTKFASAPANTVSVYRANNYSSSGSRSSSISSRIDANTMGVTSVTTSSITEANAEQASTKGATAYALISSQILTTSINLNVDSGPGLVGKGSNSTTRSSHVSGFSISMAAIETGRDRSKTNIGIRDSTSVASSRASVYHESVMSTADNYASHSAGHDANTNDNDINAKSSSGSTFRVSSRSVNVVSRSDSLSYTSTDAHAIPIISRATGPNDIGNSVRATTAAATGASTYSSSRDNAIVTSVSSTSVPNAGFRASTKRVGDATINALTSARYANSTNANGPSAESTSGSTSFGATNADVTSRIVNVPSESDLLGTRGSNIRAGSIVPGSAGPNGVGSNVRATTTSTAAVTKDSLSAGYGSSTNVNGANANSALNSVASGENSNTASKTINTASGSDRFRYTGANVRTGSTRRDTVSPNGLSNYAKVATATTTHISENSGGVGFESSTRYVGDVTATAPVGSGPSRMTVTASSIVSDADTKAGSKANDGSKTSGSDTGASNTKASSGNKSSVTSMFSASDINNGVAFTSVSSNSIIVGGSNVNGNQDGVESSHVISSTAFNTMSAAQTSYGSSRTAKARGTHTSVYVSDSGRGLPLVNPSFTGYSNITSESTAIPNRESPYSSASGVTMHSFAFSTTEQTILESVTGSYSSSAYATVSRSGIVSGPSLNGFNTATTIDAASHYEVGSTKSGSVESSTVAGSGYGTSDSTGSIISPTETGSFINTATTINVASHPEVGSTKSVSVESSITTRLTHLTSDSANVVGTPTETGTFLATAASISVVPHRQSGSAEAESVSVESPTATQSTHGSSDSTDSIRSSVETSTLLTTATSINIASYLQSASAEVGSTTSDSAESSTATRSTHATSNFASFVGIPSESDTSIPSATSINLASRHDAGSTKASTTTLSVYGTSGSTDFMGSSTETGTLHHSDYVYPISSTRVTRPSSKESGPNYTGPPFLETLSATATNALIHSDISSESAKGLEYSSKPADALYSRTRISESHLTEIPKLSSRRGSQATNLEATPTAKRMSFSVSGKKPTLPGTKYTTIESAESWQSQLPHTVHGERTTKLVVSELTTVCSSATTFTTNGVTYTATGSETITITDCPCTIEATVTASLKTTRSASVSGSTIDYRATSRNAAASSSRSIAESGNPQESLSENTLSGFTNRASSNRWASRSLLVIVLIMFL